MLANKPRAPVRISVLVPCAAGHINILPELAGFLAQQESVPDEVVIAASGVSAHQLTRASDAFKQRNLTVRLTISNARANAGQNRNRAASVATGDVLVLQDADDVPHPQRIQLIRSLFEHFNVDHLTHWYCHYRTVSIGRWLAGRCDYADAVAKTDYVTAPSSDCRITNGNPAIRKTVFQRTRWVEHLPWGEDVTFNAAAAKDGWRCAIIPESLLYYRQNLSVTPYVGHGK